MKRLAIVAAAVLFTNAAWAPFDSLALAPFDSLTLAQGRQGTQPQYDLLLKGGHVIDPRSDINRRMDVAITAGKIARVADTISAGDARKVVDVSGLFVTPGLVDIHVHVYNGADVLAEYSGDRSLPPDGFTFRSGVTTVVDLGSSGWRSFADFKTRVIDRARTRVLAMLNIVGRGMAGGSTIEQNTQDMDPEATAKVARQYPDIIVGVKTAHFTGPEWTAVDRAVAAGTAANIPVAVDFGNFNPARPFEELVTKHLRPGDWYTHMYIQRAPYFDANGKLRPYLLEARKRGVKFDVGHGGGSFSWSNAIPAIQQGFVPDSISTDLHTGSMNAGMKDMTNVMSKILNQNVPLADVIRMSTINPATQIKRPELGHLSVGAGADVAVLRVDEGKFGFLDAQGARADGTKRIVCELTLLNGNVVWDLNGRAGQDWKTFYAAKPSSAAPR
jgi:dihydroorotase